MVGRRGLIFDGGPSQEKKGHSSDGVDKGLLSCHSDRLGEMAELAEGGTLLRCCIR